ncbi:MAG: pyridoxamine 5'-phosphate oxidase family protein [Rubrivivax sp.]
MNPSSEAAPADGAVLTIAALEARVGARTSAVDLKVIDHLDAQARRWLVASPLAFAGFSDARQVSVTAAGGVPGFAAAVGDNRLRLPLAALDDPALAQPGRGAGLLFLVPGLGETLRVNGRVVAAGAEAAEIAVDECYAHCAKALLRSDFWRPDPPPTEPADAAAFLRASRFMALATADAQSHTDLSPKGDPAGLLVQAFGSDLVFADRPGNRRTDSLRNLLARPRAAALLLVPGRAQVAVFEGGTALSADPQQRQAFAVQDKTPHLVTRFASPTLVLRDSAALARARPWAVPPVPPADIDPAAVFAAHVKLNKTGGLRAALTKGVVAIPGLMRKGLDKDYKTRLY